jgi:2-polyprenyl-3-methyl-5-hydroxy-6-metoxy-1,4-benzoquinol methylase
MKIKSHYISDRDDWILNQCAGKQVLHLGCTDWPLTADRLRQGTLLHQKLVRVCASVVGIDPDEGGIKQLQQAMPKHSFYASKAEEMQVIAEVTNTHWDVILAADVVEHISNLGSALDSISSLMGSATILLITTPSAFSLKRSVVWSLGNTEHVHPDHCYYFSPSTLHQILLRSGLKVEEYGFFMWRNNRPINTLARYFLAPLNAMVGGRIADELAVSCRKR